MSPHATAAEIAQAVAGDRTSAASVVEAALARIGQHNAAVNAFTDILGERARASARALDLRHAAGVPPGPLAGVPFAVKNLFDVAGLATRAGSKINRDRPPASRDATLVTRLEAAGAVLVGALNMGEYAYDFTGENVHDGPSRNPHDLARMPGGSSGGSAAAVAAGLVPLALGSDTNGSIRVPASLCGLFGLKPTYGRLSRGGTFPFVASFDHVGPLGRSVADLALAYDAMQGLDPRDPACQPPRMEPVAGSLERGAEGVRIAIAGGHFSRNGMPEVFAAVEKAARALGVTRTVEIPEAHRARAAAFVITAAEGGNLHREQIKARAADYEPEIRDRLIAGAVLPATWVLQAQRFRRWFHDRVLEIFRDIDVILAPATPCAAPLIGQTTFILDGLELPVRPNLGVFTQPLSFIGLPVVAAPIREPGKMPVGVQVIAAPWREDLAMRVAHQLEHVGVAQAAVAKAFA
jgi:aspartyl-tRNA(Asn)/glutamyl-tRNA(Gln) amidotransferase subunit A